MQKLNYPVLVFNNCYIECNVLSERRLCMCTRETYETGFLDSFCVIDSSGFKYKVVSYQTSFRFYVLLANAIDAVLTLFMRSFNQYYTWIDFEFSEPEQITFEEAKGEILALFKKNPRWFKKSHENFKTIEEDLASYASLQDMIENIGWYP